MAGEKRNPILEALGRAAQVPARAVQMPFQLLGEIIGAGRPLSQAEGAQRALAEQVTGEQVPYSEGRKWANFLTLGLVPNNKYPSVNPTQLGPEQQQRFQQLNPLQQALLQAKNPRDFAELLQRDEFFAERGAPEPVAVGRDQRLVNPLTGEEVTAAEPRAPLNVSSGAAVVDAQGNEIYRNTPPQETFVGQADPKDFIGVFTPESIQAFSESQDFADLEPDMTKINADLEKERIKASGKKKGGNVPASVIFTQFNTKAKPYQDLADNFRGFLGTFGADPNTIPPDIVATMEGMGIDVEALSPTAIRDVGVTVAWLKSIDPTSVARESEQAAVRLARETGMPVELARNLLKGLTLTNSQRTDLFRSMRDATQAKFRGYEQLRNEFIKIAEKNEYDPEGLIPDYNRDILDMFDRLTGEKVDAPRADPEMLDRIYNDFVESGGKADDEKAFRAYADKIGVTLP